MTRAIRWTDADNLGAREALVVGGPYHEARVAVRWQESTGDYRYPDVFDLSGYRFSTERWEFTYPTPETNADFMPAIFGRSN